MAAFQMIYRAVFWFSNLLLESLFLIAYPILYIVFSRTDQLERIGIPDKQLWKGSDKPQKQDKQNSYYNILIHAASVGEINGIKPLLHSLLNIDPGLTIYLTTNTKTGKLTGQTIHPRIICRLAPLDVLQLRIRQLNGLKPRFVLIAETEIWLNLLLSAKLKHIPVCFINARISDRTLGVYRKIKELINWIAGDKLSVCAQSVADQKRFQQLYYNRVSNCGNLKFAANLPDHETSFLRQKWNYRPDDLVIVLGSSRPGEEALLLNCYDHWKAIVPHLKLIIAPRHLDRLPELAELLSSRVVTYFSHGVPAGEIHIIDEFGHLLEAYAMCDLAIIGGSFFPYGGHNPLEAAFYRKPIIMGVYHQACQDSVQKLLQNKAILISTEEELAEKVEKVLLHPEDFLSYGLRARQVMDEFSISLSLHMLQIKTLL
jgi:3-deoxy-D-manno-octulosonic-acid transferase